MGEFGSLVATRCSMWACSALLLCSPIVKVELEGQRVSAKVSHVRSDSFCQAVQRRPVPLRRQWNVQDVEFGWCEDSKNQLRPVLQGTDNVSRWPHGVRSTTACLTPAHLMHLLTLHTSPSCKSLLWTRAAYPKSTTLPPSPTVRYSPLTTAAITCCNKLFPWQPCNRGRSYIFLEPVPTTPISLVLRRV